MLPGQLDIFTDYAPRSRRSAKEPLSIERLKELLHYDQDTGVFVWKVAAKNRSPKEAGNRAGCLTKRGYREIRIDGVLYREHRLVWFYVFGHWPKDQLDHRNRDPKDNRLSNLREAVQSQNSANRILPTTNFLKGASFHRASGKWIAQISKDNKKFHLGLYDTAEKAHLSYCEAAHNLHGEFASFK